MGLFSFLQRLRASTPAAVTARLAAVEAQVGRLPAAEAEARVEQLLAGGAFRVAPPATPPARDTTELPAAAARLFARHARIALGGMVLGEAHIAPWTRAPGYVRIGTDLEHADVVVRQPDGLVAVVEVDGALEPNLEDVHPSVWHYLLQVHALTQSAAPDKAAV